MTSANSTLLPAYIKALRTHDWTYEWSDDFRVWKRGHAERQAIHSMRTVLDREGYYWNQYAPQDMHIQSRAQKLREAGFTSRPRLTGAGGLMLDKYKDGDE